MSINQLTNIIGEAYKDVNSRQDKMYGMILNRKYSNGICAIYESKKTIICGIHGASSIGLTLEAITRFFNSSRGSLSLRDVKNALKYLNTQQRNVIIASHSLGSHLYSQASMSIGTRFTHYGFSCYSPNPFNKVSINLARDNLSIKHIGVEDKLSNSLLLIKGGININKYQSLNPIVNIRTRNFHSLSIWQSLNFNKYKVK